MKNVDNVLNVKQLFTEKILREINSLVCCFYYEIAGLSFLSSCYLINVFMVWHLAVLMNKIWVTVQSIN